MSNTVGFRIVLLTLCQADRLYTRELARRSLGEETAAQVLKDRISRDQAAVAYLKRKAERIEQSAPARQNDVSYQIPSP